MCQTELSYHEYHEWRYRLCLVAYSQPEVEKRFQVAMAGGSDVRAVDDRRITRILARTTHRLTEDVDFAAVRQLRFAGWRSPRRSVVGATATAGRVVSTLGRGGREAARQSTGHLSAGTGEQFWGEKGIGGWRYRRGHIAPDQSRVVDCTQYSALPSVNLHNESYGRYVPSPAIRRWRLSAFGLCVRPCVRARSL